MKVNTRQKLFDEKGEQLKSNGEPVTIGSMLCNVLNYMVNKDPYKAHSLAMKFAKKGEVDLKSEDITFIKETLTNAPGLAPISSGQAIAIIEGDKIDYTVDEEEKDEKPVVPPAPNKKK